MLPACKGQLSYVCAVWLVHLRMGWGNAANLGSHFLLFPSNSWSSWRCSLHVRDNCHVSVQCDLCFWGWDGGMLPTWEATSCYSQITAGSVGGVPCMPGTTKLFLEGRIFIYLNVTSVWKYRLTHFHRGSPSTIAWIWSGSSHSYVGILH